MDINSSAAGYEQAISQTSAKTRSRSNNAPIAPVIKPDQDSITISVSETPLGKKNIPIVMPESTIVPKLDTHFTLSTITRRNEAKLEALQTKGQNIDTYA